MYVAIVCGRVWSSLSCSVLDVKRSEQRSPLTLNGSAVAVSVKHLSFIPIGPTISQPLRLHSALQVLIMIGI
jgi:hypothetical protein